MSLGGKVINPNSKVVIDNKGGSDVRVSGLVEAKGIDVTQKNGNVVIGDLSSNDNYLTSDGDININIEKGSLLNAGVAKTLLATKNGGNLNINVTDGTIGKPAYDGIGPDARDLTKSINANIDGTYTASAKVNSMKGDASVNLAAIDSDMKLNSINADGKVYLLADSSVKGEKNYSIINASKNSKVPNIEAKGISLIASGDIGKSGSPITFNQTAGDFNHDGFNKNDLTYQPNSNYKIDIISKSGDINIKAVDDKYDNNVGAIVAREGNINAEFSGNTYIHEITAKEGIKLVGRGKYMFIENLGKMPSYENINDY